MKKKLTLTIDDDVYGLLGELPRKVSISEVVSWMLRMMVEDLKPNGMSEDEFIDYMDNDPRGREVRQYLKEKLGPIVKNVDAKVGKFKDTIRPKGSKR